MRSPYVVKAHRLGTIRARIVVCICVASEIGPPILIIPVPKGKQNLPVMYKPKFAPRLWSARHVVELHLNIVPFDIEMDICTWDAVDRILDFCRAIVTVTECASAYHLHVHFGRYVCSFASRQRTRSTHKR